jgi:hypothetical protein
LRIHCRTSKNLDKEQHLEDHCFKLRSTVASLSEIYDEYSAKDVIASAILLVKLHIESHYLDDQDANLVHNLTSLHVYPPIPDYAPYGSDGGIGVMGASDRIRKSIGRLVARVLGVVDQARVDPDKVLLRE